MREKAAAAARCAAGSMANTRVVIRANTRLEKTLRLILDKRKYNGSAVFSPRFVVDGVGGGEELGKSVRYRIRIWRFE